MGDLNGGLGGIVLVSEGFTTDVPRARERRLPDLQGLVRASSRFRVLFYAFDPGAAAARRPTPRPQMRDDADVESSSALQSLARQTGGERSPQVRIWRRALQRVSRDLDSYYVLTFTSTEPNDGRFHTVQITSSRRDAQVRARSGYWAPLPSELRATTRAQPAGAHCRRGRSRRSPLIDSWFGLTVEPDGRRRIIFTWTPVARASADAEQAGGQARRRGAQGHDADGDGAVRRGSRGRRSGEHVERCGPTARCSRRRPDGSSSI